MTDISVYDVLARLGISTKEKKENGNSLLIICPFHADKNLGSFRINLREWKFNCFSCSTGGIGPENFVSKYLNISWKEARKWLENENLIDVNYNQYSDYTDNIAKDEVEEFIKYDDTLLKVKSNTDYLPSKLEKLKVDNFFYLKDHNITQLFSDYFKWFYCASGYYSGFAIIPIYKNNRLMTFEARKMLEYEKLCEFYNERFFNDKNQLDELKKRLKSEKFKVKDNIIYKDNQKYYIEDKDKFFMLKYLLMSKVLYPNNSNINNTVYNYDNLDINETLHVVESVSSLCNIWNNVSENVTALFGAKVSQAQLEILNRFENIILYPDIDEAGLMLTENLMHNIYSKIWVNEVNKVETATKSELIKEPEEIGKFVYRKLQEIYSGK